MEGSLRLASRERRPDFKPWALGLGFAAHADEGAVAVLGSAGVDADRMAPQLRAKVLLGGREETVHVDVAVALGASATRRRTTMRKAMRVRLRHGHIVRPHCRAIGTDFQKNPYGLSPQILPSLLPSRRKGGSRVDREFDVAASTKVRSLRRPRPAPSVHLLPVRVGEREGCAGKAFVPAPVGRHECPACLNRPRRDLAMNQKVVSRQIAALKAIVQTMMPEFYLMQSGGSPKENFFESLEKDEAIAMAISNEFTESEIEDAFGWPKEASEGGETELRATPVTPFLNAEQTERLRASMVASELGYGAREEGMPGCE